MPSVQKGEEKEHYISRCLSYPEMIQKHPNQSERAAVCYGLWNEHSKAEANKSFAEKIGEVLKDKNIDQGYGFCPVCSYPGTSAERRIDGYTMCDNGHKYLHDDRVYKKEN